MVFVHQMVGYTIDPFNNTKYRNSGVSYTYTCSFFNDTSGFTSHRQDVAITTSSFFVGRAE